MTTGVLLLHGYTGGPYEVEPFAEFLHEQTDWLIETPTLAGHGIDLQLRNTTHVHWLKDAEIAFQNLNRRVDRIIVVGFSMGGLIALYLAARYKIDRLVLLSPAAKYMRSFQLVKDVTDIGKAALNGALHMHPLYPLYEFKARHFSLRANIEFLRLVRKVSPYYKLITEPIFLVQGEQDGIVPKESAEYLLSQVNSSEVVVHYSPNSKHHICYSDDSDEWFMKALAFMRRDN